MNFDRNTRLDFRQVNGIERYFTPLPIDPPQETQGEGEEAPSPEDDEAEQLKKQQEAEEKAKSEEERHNKLNEGYKNYRMKGSGATLAFNNGNLVTLLPNGFVMQSKNKPQRKIFENSDENIPENEEDFEESRIIIGKSLIRYLAKGKIEIMHANGNFSEYNPETDLWTITNNSGKRRCKRQSDGYEYDIEAIPAAIETCGETNAKVLFKEDKVISVLYPDGSRYTVHHDGTKILTNPDETEIIYEKIGSSLIKVLKGRMIEEVEKTKNIEYSEAELEFYESLQTSRSYLKDRIKDETVIQTYLNDRSVIQSFIEVNQFGTAQEIEEPDFNMEGEGELAQERTEELKQDTKEETKQNKTKEGVEAEGEHNTEELPQQEEGPSHQAVHLIFRQDLSVTKISSDGEACIISGPTRIELNKASQLMKLGKDYDYLTQLFEMRCEDRKGGIFTCSLKNSNISTQDKDKNYFAINSNGTFEKVLAPEVSEVDQVEEQHDFEMDMEGEGMDNPIEPTQLSKPSRSNKERSSIPNVNISKSRSRIENVLPTPPRIFWIKVDGTGSEFFTKERMNNETARFGHDVEITKTTQLLGQNPVLMHSYFTEYKSGEEIDEEFSHVADLQSEPTSDFNKSGIKSFPSNVKEYPQMFRELVEKPKSKVYLFKNYLQHKDFDHFKTSAFHEDLERYKKWKEDSEQALSKRLGLFAGNEEAKDSLTPKDREIDKRIVVKIYRERQLIKEEYGYKEIKDLGIQSVTNKFQHFKEKDNEPIKVQEQSHPDSDTQKAKKDMSDGASTTKVKQLDSLNIDSPIQIRKPTDPSFDLTEPKRKRTVIIREEISELKKEPYFIPNYFDSNFGKLYIQANPPKPPNEEVMLRMSQRMSRSIGATEGGQGSSHEAERVSQYTQNNNEENQAAENEQEELNDNAIVALEPEDDENIDQMRMSGMRHTHKSKMQNTLEEPQYVPSNYLQEKEQLK